MSGTTYRHLFTPLRIGPVTVANRIVFSAHLTNYAENGRPSPQHAAYYAERAAGGAGLIITEEHSTHPTDWPYEKLIHGFHEDVIPGYRAITEAVHAHGTPIFAQINHNGGQASSMYTRLPVWAPSPVPDPLFREVPKAVTVAEIAEIVAGYALVAAHCRTGGFDGVELQCSHSSIVRGFLSEATNRRTDSYGGSLSNRARVLLEIVGAVREAIGPGMALGVRLCGDELIDHGTTIEEATAVAAMVEATGQVDYVNTSIGTATATLHMIEASMAVPPGYALWIASAMRKAVSLPVIGVGRFKDPLQADRALTDGHCDLVGVVRGQIADAFFAAKARAGLATTIRTCLSCNQECVGRMGLNRWLGCIENPRTGKEAVPLPAPVARPRQVLVAGAGPAGMQAAIAAAQAGHQVEVYESEPLTGGQVRLAASIPHRAEFGDLVRNQLAELARLDVPIHCGTAVTSALVAERQPDVVVLATGSDPDRPWWAGDNGHVVDVTDVVRAAVDVRGDILVVDELGFHQATSVAELLADRGCTVEVCTPGMVVGQDLGVTLDMEAWWMRAAAKKILQTTDVIVTEVAVAEDGRLRVSLQEHTTGVGSERTVDWVVLAVPAKPRDALWAELAGTGIAIHRVGDCLAPRRAHAAVIEGQRIGAAL
ncbi:MAG TPA: mycofactocin system FadH/OYE family oxidoreductase 2 [Mycobacteriales bacterium]|nr:mycofactocin system FadH/OYE family oxidoreductase 2 [Mycobacteriales bacterium]